MTIDRRTWLLRRAFPITVASLLILTLLTVGLTYVASSRLLREKLDEANEAALAEIVGRVDTLFDVIDHLLVASASDPDVRVLLSATYPSRATYLLEASHIQTRLAGVRRTVPIVHSIALVSLRRNEILSDSIGASLADSFEPGIAELIRSVGVDGGVVGPRTAIVRQPHSVSMDEVLYVIRPYPLGAPGALATGGIVAVVPLAALRHEIERYAADVGLTVDATLPDGSALFAPAGRRGGERAEWLSQPVISRRTGIVFLASADLPPSHAGLRRVRRVVIAIAIGGVVVASLLALLLDRGFRRPWEETVLAIAGDVEANAHPSEDVAERSAWTLPSIRREVHDVIARARELEDRYEATREAMLWQTVVGALLAPQIDSPGGSGTLGQIGLDGPSYQVVLIDLAEPRGQRSPSGAARQEELTSLASRSFESIGAAHTVRLPDGMLATVVCPASRGASLPRRSRALVVALRRQGYPQAASAVGGVHTGSGAIHSSYVEASFALEFRVVRPDAPVIAYDDVSRNAAPLMPRSVADRLDRIPETMHYRSGARLGEWADDFLACVERECSVPVAFKHALARFVTDASEAAARLRLRIDSAPPDFHHSIWTGRNRAEVERVFHDAVRWYCDALDGQDDGGIAEARGRELVRIVDELLFDAALSLTLVADRVGASTAHVSRLFRRTAGLTFQEYVARARAERASTLLRETADTVRDVALAVGYPEVHTLIRVFKRQYGTTPAEYRRVARAGV